MRFDSFTVMFVSSSVIIIIAVINFSIWFFNKKQTENIIIADAIKNTNNMIKL